MNFPRTGRTRMVINVGAGIAFESTAVTRSKESTSLRMKAVNAANVAYSSRGVNIMGGQSCPQAVLHIAKHAAGSERGGI